MRTDSANLFAKKSCPFTVKLLDDKLLDDESLASLLPASYRTRSDDLAIPSDDDTDYLLKELSLDRLNKIHSLLWLVGRPMPPRALHHQILLGREIAVTEQMDMHLVWTKGWMFLKPIPRFVLDPDFWTAHLSCSPGCGCLKGEGPANDNECNKQRLRKCALGLIFSYIALVSHESDFFIAKEKHLLPTESTWPKWRKLVQEILNHNGGAIYGNVNKRFIYGELRLSRLNKIYRLTQGPFCRGYMSSWNRYVDFFQANLAILASATAYIVIILTAMQVGLATNALSDNDAFQSASYGFTIFSILGPLVAFLLILVAFCFIFVTNWIATKKYEKKRFPSINVKAAPTNC